MEISLVGQGLAGEDPEVGESRTIDLKVMLEPSFNLEDGAKFHLEDEVDLSLDASVSTVLWMDQGLNIHQVTNFILNIISVIIEVYNHYDKFLGHFVSIFSNFLRF